MGTLVNYTGKNPAAVGALPIQKAIHYLADSATSITGIETCYDYGSNVLDVPSANLPALLLAPDVLTPERAGAGELWRSVDTIQAILLVKEFDDAARLQYLPYLEPEAFVYGWRFNRYFNTSIAAHTRRQTFCANTSAHDMVLSAMSFGTTDWGSRTYLSWTFQFLVTWRGYDT